MLKRTIILVLVLTVLITFAGFGLMETCSGGGKSQDSGSSTSLKNGHQGDGSTDGINQVWGGPNSPEGD